MLESTLSARSNRHPDSETISPMLNCKRFCIEDIDNRIQVRLFIEIIVMWAHVDEGVVIVAYMKALCCIDYKLLVIYFKWFVGGY